MRVCVCASENLLQGVKIKSRHRKRREIGVLNPSSVGHSGGVLRETDLELSPLRAQKLPVHKWRGGIGVRRDVGRECDFGLKVIIQIVPPTENFKFTRPSKHVYTAFRMLFTLLFPIQL